jgi:8-oxo-dGTP pyrophosphatase MutT (NUDIX family)
VQAIVDKVGKSRSALLVGFIILRAFSAATLDTFRAAGITHVGTKPESRSARIVTDAKKSKAPKGKKLSKIYSQERKLQSLGEVDVLTAGDDDVCPICEDISEEGPYDIDTAETLIPAHPNCRCAFVPADDMRFAHDSQTHTAAGIMFHDRTGRVLFVRRSDNSDHAGEWCFPGGAIEPGETAEMAARREALEETGHSTSLPLEQIDRRELGGVDFTTFVVEVPEPFAPVLDSEHTDAVWRMPTDAPEPLHPGVRATIDAALTNDADWNEEDHPRDKIGRFTDGSGSDFDKAQKEFKRLDSSPEGEQMVTNEYGLTYSKRNIAFDNLGGVYRKTADETFDRELTKDEKKSINSYQKNSRLSTKMNETLRSGGKLDEKQTLVSKHLDAVLNDTSLKQDHTLYRGLTGNKGRALVKDLKPGDTITDKGYMSTSLDEDTARGFSQGKKDQDDLHVMRILADKGQHALLTGERSGVQVSSQEYEAILPRGTTLKFHGKSAGKFGVTYYDMEIVKNSKGTKVSDDFNPNQPRDKYGKWTETGAESASAKASAFAETLKNSGVDNVETYHDKANGVHKVFVNTTHEGAHEAFVSASLKHGVPLEHTEIHGDTLAAKFQESDTTPEQKLDKAVAHLMLGGDAEDNDVHKNENYEDFDTGETKPMYEVKVGTTGEFEKLAKQAGVEVQNIGELNEEGSHVGYLIVGHAQPANAPTPTHVEQTQPVAEPTGLVTNEIDFSGLTKVGGQKGSNEGGVYKDKGGNEYYVKSMDEAHAKNERLAASLYQLTGAPTLDYVDVKPNGNTHFVATKFEKLEKGNVSEFDKYDRQAAQVNFATHAWLANWDAAGTGGDNQGVSKTGTVKTLDVGGSLEYRAKGAPKGAAFGTSVEEFNTLRDPSKNADAAKLFGDMTNEQIKASVEKVASIPDHVIRDAVLKGGGTEALADKLIARKNDLNIRAAALGNPALEKAIAAPTTTASTVDHPAKIFKSQVSGTSAERVAMRKKLQELPSYSEEAKTTKLKIIASFWKQHDKLSKTSATKAADIASKLGQYALKYKVANPLTTPTVAAPKTATTVSPVVSTPKPAETPTTFFKPPPGPDLSSMTEDQVRVHMLDKVTHGGANDWVKSGATELQKSAKLQKAGLTASEIAYVRAFTGPYSGLNKQLRDGHMSEEVFYFKHIMNDALDKFPVYDGDTVWRKISVDDATRAKYNKVGSIVHWPAFSSTAKNPKVWSGNTQFVIHHPKTGRDVQFISTHKSEAEVVMPADTYYKVLAAPTMKKCEDGVTRNVIELEEVVPFGKKKVRAA